MWLKIKSLSDTDKRQALLFSLAGAVPVIWIALLVAPYANNLLGILEHMNEIFADP